MSLEVLIRSVQFCDSMFINFAAILLFIFRDEFTLLCNKSQHVSTVFHIGNNTIFIFKHIIFVNDLLVYVYIILRVLLVQLHISTNSFWNFDSNFWIKLFLVFYKTYIHKTPIVNTIIENYRYAIVIFVNHNSMLGNDYSSIEHNLQCEFWFVLLCLYIIWKKYHI